MNILTRVKKGSPKREEEILELKKIIFLLSLTCCFILPSFVQAQPDRAIERFLDRIGPKIEPGDLRIQELAVSPDPFRPGQPVSFTAVIANRSRITGRVNLAIKDRDELVAEVHDLILQAGNNRISFPQTRYRFERDDTCFSVEVDIERTRRPVDLAREFCARRTYEGWTMNINVRRVGPLIVEDLDISPDPVNPGEEVRFRARVRNDGVPVQGALWLQDKDQVVAELRDVFIPPGRSEYNFPYSRYVFQRFDHCFTVILDADRTPYRMDSAREFCAKPAGWTLRP